MKEKRKKCKRKDNNFNFCFIFKAKENFDKEIKTFLENLNDIDEIVIKTKDDKEKKDKIVMTKKELFALVLKDLFGLNCEKAANFLETSRPTYWRILSSARKKLAYALIEKINIKIENDS